MTNREIDALVAFHAFGWRHYRLGDRKEVHFMSPETVATHYIKSLCPVEVDSGENTIDAPAYSTDPAASKHLRDRMAALGWSWDTSYLMPIARYSCMFVSKKHDRVAKSEGDETEELAVAVAALRALGVQVE